MASYSSPFETYAGYLTVQNKLIDVQGISKLTQEIMNQIEAGHNAFCI